MGKESGYSVLDLAVVGLIAIVMVGMAIPVVSFMEQSSSERNAADSLRFIATGNLRFNKDHSSAKYWVGDVYGLYRIRAREPKKDEIIDGMKMIEKSTADADGAVLAKAPDNKGSDVISYDPKLTHPEKPKSHKGYFFRVLQDVIPWGDEKATKYHEGSGLNATRWGYIAYPEKYAKGYRLCFKIEAETSGKIYKRDPAFDIEFKEGSTYTRWESKVLESGWSLEDQGPPKPDKDFVKEIEGFVSKFNETKKDYKEGGEKFQKGVKELSDKLQKLAEQYKEDPESIEYALARFLDRGVKYLSLCCKVNSQEFSKLRDYYFRVADEIMSIADKVKENPLQALQTVTQSMKFFADCPMCEGNGLCIRAKCDDLCILCGGSKVCRFCFGEGEVLSPLYKALLNLMQQKR